MIKVRFAYALLLAAIISLVLGGIVGPAMAEPCPAFEQAMADIEAALDGAAQTNTGLDGPASQPVSQPVQDYR